MHFTNIFIVTTLTEILACGKLAVSLRLASRKLNKLANAYLRSRYLRARLSHTYRKLARALQAYRKLAATIKISAS